MKLDDKDRQIIRAVQRDGRITNLALAEEVNLSPTPCLRRLRQLEESRVITGYSANVDPKRFGLSLLAFISVSLKEHSKESLQLFESRVLANERIMSCHLMTGSRDYLLQVLVKDLDSYDEFVREELHEIGGIASMDTSIAFSVVKQTAVFPSL